MAPTFTSEAYYNNIRDKLAYLVTLVEMDNSVNLQSLNIHAEGFFAEFLNCLFGWQLDNANLEMQNAPGIDLRYAGGKIIAQVSSTYTHKKIQSSLEKSDCTEYCGYHFYFVAITKKTQNYTDFTVPDGIAFDKDKDVLDTSKLLSFVLNAGNKKQKALSELMDKYFSSDRITPKGRCLTAPPAYADTKQIICREDELTEITDKLQKGENVLLMSGFGGIGKTALARLVFHTAKENYDEVAWIPYHGGLKDSMLAAIQGFENVNDPEARWNEILSLKNNGKSKLFVIDNADQHPQKDDILKALTGWPNTTVIVTSRQASLPHFTPYSVGFMDEDKCVELFYRYYENLRRTEDENVVRQLIQLAGCHTFTVELLAKGANCEDSLEEYYQDLKEKGFAFPDIEVDAAHNDATTTIAGHLKILFDRKTRTDIQMKLLYDLSVLPAAATLSKKEIKTWFGIDINPCEQMVKDGWFFRENGRYSMHPLVKEILHLDIDSIPKDTAEEFLTFIEDYDNHYFRMEDIYTETNRKLELAESVVAALCREDTIQLAHILHNIGSAYRQAGQYQKAKERYERAIAIKEAKLGEDHPDTASTYNGIAGVYQDLDKLPKALEFHKRAKVIREAKLGADHLDTASTYNNIALVYKANGDLNKALEFYEKAKAIREAKLGKDHADTATTYNNMALVYKAKGDLEKALKVHEKIRKVKEAKLGEDHPSTATTYNNIALVYKAMGNLEKALEYHEKTRIIKETKLGKDHPSTATTYHNISAVYYKQKDYLAAKLYLLKALKIRLIKIGPGHANTKNTLSRLFACYKAEGGVQEDFNPWLMEQLNEEERQILSAHLQQQAESSE